MEILTVGSLEEISFFLERQMRLLCFIERREGKGRKEKREKMPSTKGSNEGFLLYHTVVYVYVYVLAGRGQGNIRTGYLLRLPLYLQAFLCYCVTMSF